MGWDIQGECLEGVTIDSIMTKTAAIEVGQNPLEEIYHGQILNAVFCTHFYGYLL